MANEFVKKFEKCPVCALKEWLIKTLKLKEEIPEGAPFFGTIVKELKESGIAKEDFNFTLDSKRGPVANQQMLTSASIGSELPGFAFSTDICSDCGCIYATHIERGKVKKGIQLATSGQMPNRAERRRTERNGEIYPPLGESIG